MFFDNTVRTVLFFIVGVILTVVSFVGYYVWGISGWLLHLIYAFDVAYLYLNAYAILEIEYVPWFKAILLTVGYFVAFHLIFFLIFLANGGASFFFSVWGEVLRWSIFVGPCLLILFFAVVLIIKLISHYGP